MAVDHGNFYVVDRDNHRVQKIELTTSALVPVYYLLLN